MKRRNRIGMVLVVFAMAIAGVSLPVAGQSFDQGYEPIRSGSFVQDKNFYLFTLIDGIPEVLEVVKNDSELRSVSKAAMGRIESADLFEIENNTQVAQMMKIPQSDIDKAGDRLAELAESSEPIQSMIEDHMRASGYFSLHRDLDDPQYLRAAWEDAANAVNRIVDVYILGEDPHYHKIDSSGYDVTSRDFARYMANGVAAISEQSDAEVFFRPLMGHARVALLMSGRDEAGRYEPMAQTVNAQAHDRARSIDWDDYDYTAMIVCGQGPDDGERLSPRGRVVCMLAARKYHDGEIAFIITSGGHVWPNRTPFAEAIEMRKYMVEHLGVPYEAIVVDPHARHTTTNVRNGVRLLWGLGAPIDREAMIVTHDLHTDYIDRNRFTQRCLDELGYAPWTSLHRLNETAIAFTPNPVSLYRDASDPLDP